MKSVMLIAGLLVVAGLVSARTEDNPSQAAARAALVKMLFGSQQPLQPATNHVSAAAPDRGTMKTVPVAVAPKKQTPVKPTTRWDAELSVADPVKSAPPSAAPAPANARPLPPEIAATPTNQNSAPTVAPTTTPKVSAPNVEVSPLAPKPVARTVRVATKLPAVDANVLPANNLVTLTGTVFKDVQVARVETNAIVISYVPRNGGVAMTRVYFEELPTEVRQQYEKK